MPTQDSRDNSKKESNKKVEKKRVSKTRAGLTPSRGGSLKKGTGYLKREKKYQYCLHRSGVSKKRRCGRAKGENGGKN